MKLNLSIINLVLSSRNILVINQITNKKTEAVHATVLNILTRTNNWVSFVQNNVIDSLGVQYSEAIKNIDYSIIQPVSTILSNTI